MDEKKEFKCNVCNKFYKNYKSLWKHNYVYHKKEDIQKKIINGKIKKKFICDKCDKTFNNLEKIKEHVKNDCRPSIKSNNVYTFKTDTFGKNKYEKFKGGDIYIIQTEFNLKGFYKIGISTNIYKRLAQYRCGAVLEPKLHYYYPCKNIKETDKKLKEKLKKFNIKREIYKADNIDELRNLIKEIQKDSNSSELEIIPENKQCDIKGCDYCNLYFTNNQDLLNHIIINHKEQVATDVVVENVVENVVKNVVKNNVCKKCNKSLSDRISRWKHEKICMVKDLEKENNEIKKELLEIKNKEALRDKEMLEYKKEMEKMKDIIQKSLKIHPPVFAENQSDSFGVG